jgi:O-antigen/teichoic acid export membrane protein
VVGFGTALTLCQFFWIIQSQSDIVIAGRSFAAHDMGLYSESLFLTLIFTGRFLPPLNEVAFPAYAELSNAGKPLASAFLASARMILLVAAPFYVGLSLTAGPLVETFFGPKWLEMIPIVSGLALAMPIMTLQILCSPATNALGKPGIYVLTSAAGAIIMPLCYLYGATQTNPMGLVHAWHIAAPLLLFVTLLVTLPALGARFVDLIVTLLPVAVACSGMAAAVYTLDLWLAALPAAVHLGLLALAGAAVYFAILWFVWPDILRSAWLMLRKPKAAVAV